MMMGLDGHRRKREEGSHLKRIIRHNNNIIAESVVIGSNRLE